MEAFRPLLIAVLVITEVGIWQWRMVIAHRGSRVSAMLLGVIGAVLQITAITQVVADVHDPLSIAAYAGGVGFGVLFGLVAGDRLTPGLLGVTVVTTSPDMVESLWDIGWPATAHAGHSVDGPVMVVSVAVSRREEQRLHDDLDRIAPDAFRTSKELRAANQQVRQRATVPRLDGPNASDSRHSSAGDCAAASFDLDVEVDRPSGGVAGHRRTPHKANRTGASASRSRPAPLRHTATAEEVAGCGGHPSDGLADWGAQRSIGRAAATARPSSAAS
jgi:uncharacterized protein YebE (UPF0316 family)